MTYRYWIEVSLRMVLVTLTALAIYYLLSITIPLLYPFLIGWILAMLIEPLVSKLEKKLRMPRWAGSTLILFLILGLIFSLLTFLFVQLVVELTHLAEKIPSLLNQISQFFFSTFVQENTQMQLLIETIQNYLGKYPDHKQGIQSSIQDNLMALTEQGTAIFTDILSGVGRFLGNLPFLFMVVIFITLATYFISVDWPRFRKTLHTVIPERVQITSSMVFKEIRRATFGFIRAQVTLITITGIIVLIGLLILQVPYAVTIAILIALVDMLPYLGVGAVVIPWIIYLILVHNYFWAIGLFITYLVVLVIRQSLEPKLVASNVGLDPLITLIALFVGLKIFGVVGLILGPIITVVIMALYRAQVLSDLKHFILKKDA